MSDYSHGEALTWRDAKILKLEAEVERLNHELLRWIPVEERLPEDGFRGLAATSDGIFAVLYHEGISLTGWIAAEGATVFGVTHWQPLPEPPEVTD